MKTDREEIAKILRDNITFSPQTNDYVIHGAIDKLIDYFKNQSQPIEKEPSIEDIAESRSEELEFYKQEIERLKESLKFSIKTTVEQQSHIKELRVVLGEIWDWAKCGFVHNHPDKDYPEILMKAKSLSLESSPTEQPEAQKEQRMTYDELRADNDVLKEFYKVASEKLKESEQNVLETTEYFYTAIDGFKADLKVKVKELEDWKAMYQTTWLNLEMYKQLLGEANSLLRSTHSIAQRDGKDTRWDAFLKQVDMALKKQHEVMYPTEQQKQPQPEKAQEEQSELWQSTYDFVDHLTIWTEQGKFAQWDDVDRQVLIELIEQGNEALTRKHHD